jgi:hypothetical protein
MHELLVLTLLVVGFSVSFGIDISVPQYTAGAQFACVAYGKGDKSSGFFGVT